MSTGSNTNPSASSILKQQYKVQKKLGEGGMGQVYLAVDTLNQRPVAVKSISTAYKDEHSLQRLAREYRILQMIEHPNVVKGYDFFEENCQMFLVMEFIPGISMKEYIQTNPDPPLLEKLAIANQLCRAVEVLNTAGILHRDLKPANIMVNKASGKIKLLDMGLGKKLKPSKESLLLTRQGDIVGTPAYLSPEQVMGKVSEKSDVFALGIVLYQLFAWQKSSPFQADDSLSTMLKISEGKIPDLNSQIQGELTKEESRVYKKISNLVSQALVKDVDKRLSSAKEMGDACEGLYQELKHGRTGSKPVDKSETNWGISTSISPVELEKLHVFKRQQEEENSRYDLGRTQRRNKTKSESGVSSWRSRLTVMGIVGLLLLPMALSLALSKKQESPKKPNQAQPPAIQEQQQSKDVTFGLPEDIWSKCKYQHDGQWLLDMTTGEWGALSATDQQQYAAAYQRGYAREKNLDVERTVMRGNAEFVMRLIPPGRFWMGSDDDVVKDAKKFWQSRNWGNYDETKHRVVISSAFWMQLTETTQRQWKAVTSTTPWSGQKDMEENELWPAVYISWNDIHEKFLPRMGSEFAFPTEAQWEYACRAGTTYRYFWGESDSEMGSYANCFDLTAKESGKQATGGTFLQTRDGYAGIAPVQSLKANGYGLYDMSGNVWEWCKDWYGDYPAGDTVDPAGSAIGTNRVIRGGSWEHSGFRFFRSSSRSKDVHAFVGRTKGGQSSKRNEDVRTLAGGSLGFRVVSPIR